MSQNQIGRERRRTRSIYKWTNVFIATIGLWSEWNIGKLYAYRGTRNSTRIIDGIELTQNGKEPEPEPDLRWGNDWQRKRKRNIGDVFRKKERKKEREDIIIIMVRPMLKNTLGWNIAIPKLVCQCTHSSCNSKHINQQYWLD
mgnify:CR=1 FL=1